MWHTDTWPEKNISGEEEIYIIFYLLEFQYCRPNVSWRKKEQLAFVPTATMKVTDSFFLAFFPKSAQKACFLSQPFFPSLVERRMNRRFRDLSPSSDWCCEKKEKGERENGKEEKFPFFLGRECCYCLDPLSTLKHRSDTTRQQKWGIKTSFLRLPSSSFLSPIVVRNLIWPERKGGKERERQGLQDNDLGLTRTVSYYVFRQQKNFHNGRLANLIVGRSTAVRDVRRPLWQKIEIFASAPVASRKLQVMMGTGLRREQRGKKGSWNLILKKGGHIKKIKKHIWINRYMYIIKAPHVKCPWHRTIFLVFANFVLLQS